MGRLGIWPGGVDQTKDQRYSTAADLLSIAVFSSMWQVDMHAYMHARPSELNTSSTQYIMMQIDAESRRYN